jgi:hypothetical protein
VAADQAICVQCGSHLRGRFGRSNCLSCSTCFVPVAATQVACVECGTPVQSPGGVLAWLRMHAGGSVLAAVLAGGALAAYVALADDPPPQASVAGTPSASVPSGLSSGAGSADAPAGGATQTVATAPAIPAVTPTPAPAVPESGVTGAAGTPASSGATGGRSTGTAAAGTTGASRPAAGTTGAGGAAGGAAGTTGASGTATGASGATGESGPASSVKAPAAITPPAPGTPTGRQRLTIGKDDVSTYNSAGLAAASFNSPADAVDGDPSTSWSYQLDPRTAGATNVGLAVKIKPARRLSSITLATATPGMTVELYGATGALPATITDPLWVHIATRGHLAASMTVPLDSQPEAFDYLLIWITHAPPGVNTGVVGVSNLSITG